MIVMTYGQRSLVFAHFICNYIDNEISFLIYQENLNLQ